MEIRNVGVLTEISAEDGKYITESYPTYFNTFCTKKILVNGDSVDNYKEVNATEKGKIEAKNAEWERPPQSFIDEWNEACKPKIANGNVWMPAVGIFNENSGYFELNGLADITYKEAIKIMDCYIGSTAFRDSRTNLPLPATSAFDTNRLNNFSGEVIWGLPINRTTFVASQNSAVREYRWLKINSFISYMFQNHNNLTTIKDVSISAKGTMPLTNLSKLTYETMDCLIKANPSGNVLSVHSDVYAKLTGDTTNAAAAALTAEELAEWQALVPLAAEKNITFVTQ